MKRLLISATILCTLVTFGYSQISFRPQVGVNFPSLSKEISQGKFQGNAGYQFGADLQLGGKFYIQPGLNFESARLSREEGESIGDITISRINIPVVAGFRVASTENHSVGLRAFAGPNFAIHVNEDLDASLGFINKNNIRDAQISGLVGAGLDLSILFVDVAYKFGLTDFFEDINSDSRINLFYVSAGIRIGF